MTCRKSGLYWGLLGLILGLALALRLPRLEQRPMHVDEAVHAVKTGLLLDQGVYRFDPQEFHGPTLYYLTLPIAWLSGARAFVETSEWMYRLAPLLFGGGLILLFPLVAGGLGRAAILSSALLMAISPAMTFYSRYYIHEMLLVFFSFTAIATGWRYARSGHAGWATLAGLSLGLMVATKETWIIVAFAMGVALGLTWALARLRREPLEFPPAALSPRRLLLGMLVGAAVAAIFYSSFFMHPTGVLDALMVYSHYFRRGSAGGIHQHPWYFYLNLLIYFHNAPGPIWSEGLIAGLGLVGIVAALLPLKNQPIPSRLPCFLALYTLCMTCIYCLIPYKTPWCLLGFLHGLILLAGFGLVTLFKLAPSLRLRLVIAMLLGAGSVHLGLQAMRTNFVFFADPRNPYVYAHSVPDIKRLAKRIGTVAALHPARRDMLVKIISPDYWPLPWYLRRFRQVGYWSEMPEAADAPVIVTSPALQDKMRVRLRDAYQEEYYGLRPDILLVVYIRQDLWRALIASRSGVAP